MNAEDIRRNEFLTLQRAHEEERRFKAQEAESNNEVDKLVQLAHMLISLSMNIFANAEDILEEQGFALDRALVKSQFYYNKAATNYCREFATMIKTELESNNYWNNLQELETKVRKWAGLDKQDELWINVTEGLPEPGKKVVVVTKSGNYGLNSTTEFPSGIEWKGSRKYTDSIMAWMPVPEYKFKEK